MFKPGQAKRMIIVFFLVMWIGNQSAQVFAEEVPELLEPAPPEYLNIPVPLITDNLITRKLGGAHLDLDLFTGIYETYESNIYQSATREKSDYILTSLIGFDADYYEPGVYRIESEGNIAYKHYTKNEDASDFEADLDASITHKINEMFTALILGEFSRTYDSYESPPKTEEYTSITNRYDAGFELHINPSRLFRVETGVNFFQNSCTKAYKDLASYRMISGSVAPMYNITLNSRIGVEASGGSIRHEESAQNDADYFEGLVKYEWRYMDTMDILVKAGWQNRNYNSEGTVPDGSDYSDYVLHATVYYKFLESSNASIVYRHSPMQANVPERNYDIIDNLLLQVNYEPRERTRLSLRSRVRHLNPSLGTTYTNYGGSISFRYSLTELIGIGCAYDYLKREYSDESSANWDDHKISFGINFCL